MTQYARIKSFNGKLFARCLKKGVWYEIKEISENYFEMCSNKDICFCEHNSSHLNGGDWEIVEGNVMYYGPSIIGGWMCPRSSDGEVGVDGCRGCKHLLDTDEENQTITCGYPQNKEKTMDVYEALAKAEYGDVVEADQFCRITKGRVKGVFCDDPEYGVDIDNLFEENWRVV